LLKRLKLSGMLVWRLAFPLVSYVNAPVKEVPDRGPMSNVPLKSYVSGVAVATP